MFELPVGFVFSSHMLPSNVVTGMRPKHEAGVHTSGKADVLVVTRMSKWEQATETLGSLTISSQLSRNATINLCRRQRRSYQDHYASRLMPSPLHGVLPGI